LGQEHPFVLVGHSFGGIVIESLVIEIHRISQQQHRDSLGKRDVENANVFLKNMARVAFYAIPHVGSRQLIKYICRQCEIDFHSKQLAKATQPIDDNVVSDEHCQLCNGCLVLKDYCIKIQENWETFGFAGYDCGIWTSPNFRT